MKQSKALPASKRTISLFTGKTDAESEAARDGTEGNPRRSRPPKRRVWTPLGLSEWESSDQYRIRKIGNRYYLTRHAKDIGEFASLIDATNSLGPLR